MWKYQQRRYSFLRCLYMSNGDLFSLRYHCVGPIDRLARARTRGSARSSFFRRLTLAVAIEGYPMCRSVLTNMVQNGTHPIITQSRPYFMDNPAILGIISRFLSNFAYLYDFMPIFRK